MNRPVEDIQISAFRVPLPTDGTHPETVTQARACGMRWTQLQASEVVNASKRAAGRFIPALGLVLVVEGNVMGGLASVIHKIESCNRMQTKMGLGYVPETGRVKLERLRNVCRQLADSIDELLA